MSHQICSEKLTSLSQNSLPLITHTTNTEQIHKIIQTKTICYMHQKCECVAN